MDEKSQLGEYLRERRRELGLSYEDVSDRTKIQLHHLQSLDTGLYAQLPAETYLKGFLVNYAEVLDVPAEKLLELYRLDRPEKVPVNLKPPEPIKTYGIGDSPAGKRGVFFIALLVAVVIAAGSWWFAVDDNPSDSREVVRVEGRAPDMEIVKESAEPTDSVLMSAQNTEPRPSDALETVQALNAESSSEPDAQPVPLIPAVDRIVEGLQPEQLQGIEIAFPSAIELKAIDSVTVEVTIDGRPLQRYSLQKGSLLRWRVKRSVIMRLIPPQGAEIHIGDVQVFPDRDGSFVYPSLD